MRPRNIREPSPTAYQISARHILSLETPLEVFEQDRGQTRQVPVHSAVTAPPVPLQLLCTPPWPQWPKNPVGDKLESLALTVVGTDSELNWAMCQALAKRIGWFPTFTGKVLAGMHKAASWREVADAQGWEKLGEQQKWVEHRAVVRPRRCPLDLGSCRESRFRCPCCTDELYTTVGSSQPIFLCFFSPCRVRAYLWQFRRRRTC